MNLELYIDVNSMHLFPIVGFDLNEPLNFQVSRRQDLDRLLMPEAAGSQMRKVLHGMLQFNVENRSSATQTIERMEGKKKHCSHIRPGVNCKKKRGIFISNRRLKKLFFLIGKLIFLTF